MKKLITVIALCAASSVVSAQPRHGHHGHHGHRHSDVIVPMVIGTVIGYGMGQASRREEHVPPAPVIVNVPVPTPSYPQVVVQTGPRIIPLERPAQPVYDRRTQYDPNCNCHVEVWVQTGWR